MTWQGLGGVLLTVACWIAYHELMRPWNDARRGLEGRCRRRRPGRRGRGGGREQAKDLE